MRRHTPRGATPTGTHTISTPAFASTADPSAAQPQETALLFRNAGLAFSVNLASGALLAYANSALGGAPRAAVAWYGTIVLIGSARYALARQYQGQAAGLARASAWRRAYILATVLMAAAWGLGGAYFVWDAPDTLRLLNVVALGGMVAGAVPVLAPSATALRAYTLLVCMPVVGVILHQASSPLHWAFGGLAAVFPLAIVASAHHLHDTLTALIGANLEKSRLLAQLRASEARVHEIVDYSPIGMAVAATDGRMLKVNQALRAMLGYEPGGIEQMPILDLTHPDDRADCARELARLVSGALSRFQLEKRFLRKDGSVIWAQVTASLLPASADAPACILGQVEDITERRMWRERMHYAANYDALTDLPNRRLLSDLAKQSLAEAARHGRAAAVLYVDVDRFKDVNDSLGHEVGDELLKAVAARLKQCVRRGDIVSRHGGDEFVVVLNDLEQGADAAAVVRKILDAFAEPVAAGKGRLAVTMSVGISLFPGDGTDDVDELISKADAAMYAAKLQGRGSYRHYHEAVRVLGTLQLPGRGVGAAGTALEPP